MASEQDFDTSVMENEQLKQEVEDKMKEMEDRATGRLQAEIAATREQMKAQFGDLMDLLAKGQGQQGNGRGRNNKMVKVAVVEAKATTMDEPIEKSAARRQVPERQVPEILLSLQKLPVDQRKALSAKLRAVEQDTSVGPARKAKIARDFIAKAAKSLEAQRSMLEEQTHTEVDEVEAEAAQVKEPTEAPAAPEGVHEVLLSLTKLPAGQRRVLSGKLREILKDTSIDRDERARVVSILIRRWSHEDQSEVQVTDIEEELLGCEGSSVSEVGVINEVDIDDGTQNMEVLAPLEEQQEQELAEDRNQDLLAMEVVSAPDVELIREEQWPPEETKSGGEVKVNAVGEHELLWNDDVTMESELSKKPHVVMDDLKLEEPVILGKIEIGVDVGAPDVVNEHLNVSDTARSKENPVVGISTVSGITMMEIIAGDDVKAKDIGKSGDFQAGDAIRDDSVVSIMSMNYKGWQTGDLSRMAPWSGCSRVRLTHAVSFGFLCFSLVDWLF